jgi:hypothetical protein
MQSYPAPGTPTKYNQVGVIRIGPNSAKNVLVLEPGTSAGSAYFVPLAKWIVEPISSPDSSTSMARVRRHPKPRVLTGHHNR